MQWNSTTSRRLDPTITLPRCYTRLSIYPSTKTVSAQSCAVLFAVLYTVPHVICHTVLQTAYCRASGSDRTHPSGIRDGTPKPGDAWTPPKRTRNEANHNNVYADCEDVSEGVLIIFTHLEPKKTHSNETGASTNKPLRQLKLPPSRLSPSKLPPSKLSSSKLPLSRLPPEAASFEAASFEACNL
jgi:hypothetical protein